MIRVYAEIFCWKNESSFCSAKATHIFSAKNIRILYIESAKTVNEMTLNELVKLTTLWTTGPWLSPPQLYIGWRSKVHVNPFNWLNSISLFLKVNPYTCEMMNDQLLAICFILSNLSFSFDTSAVLTAFCSCTGGSLDSMVIISGWKSKRKKKKLF